MLDRPVEVLGDVVDDRHHRRLKSLGCSIDELVEISDDLASGGAQGLIVKRWVTATYETLRRQGLEPLAVVGRATEPLDGYEEAVRSRPTNLTQLIAETFLAEVPEADAVAMASGLVRVDGIIPPGDITYFDVVRIFPMGGKLSVLSMPGRLLRPFLDMGRPRARAPTRSASTSAATRAAPGG